MGNLTQRVLTAVLGIPVLLFVFYRGGVLFLLLFLLIISVGLFEFFKLLETKGVSSERVFAVLSSVFLAAAAYFGYLHFLAVFTVLMIIAFVYQFRKQDLSDAIVELGTTLIGIIYLGWFLSHAILLRNLDHNLDIKNYAETVQGIKDAGFFYVVFVVACTFLNDTGAYFAGKWKGKKKLIPRISPGKTVEGTIGGIISSTITGGVVNLIFKSPLEYGWAFLLGFIIGVVAVFGDLIESLIKRSVGVKDSGGILPGHGGVLDRFDSLIVVFPVSYYFVLLYYWFNGVF
ncbi:MAG: phosphatidate cytidylyltransferase [Deltaproteobacteria bacterium]|nr:phosphatidate cytidylyltransferase [Deltaproteobacteria bacterium]